MTRIPRQSKESPSRSQTAVAAPAAVVLTIIWSHAGAVLIHGIMGVQTAPMAAALTWVAVFAAAVGVIGWRDSDGSAATGALFAAAFAAMALWALLPSVLPTLASLAVVAPVIAVLGRRLAMRVPTHVAAVLGRRVCAVVWSVGALLTLVQFGRLTNHMTDPQIPFVLSTSDPFWAEHECLPAYVHAGELSARGEPNVYHAAHYPGINPAATPRTDVRGMNVEDPYQYAPQFLLLPRLALALTDHYPTIRSFWFAAQVSLFLLLFFGLVTTLGGAASGVALVSLPLALTSFATLYNFQYGQVHLLAIVLAVWGMSTIARGREASGGAALALAILIKLFPAVLLLPLLAQRKWRALFATTATCLVVTLGAVAVVGLEPFHAFIDYQLPRLQSGAAFAFWDAWPEARTLIIADNQGIYGVVLKLGELGLPGMGASVAALLSSAYMAAVAALGFVAGRGTDTDAGAVPFWLGLVGLASLGSPGAFGDYVPAVAMMLLSVMAHRIAAAEFGRARQATVGVVAVALYTVLGTAPIGAWFEPGVMLPLSLATALALFAVCAWPVFDRLSALRALHRGPATLVEAA